MPNLPVRALRPGSRIRVVAPSSPFSEADFRAGVARLEERYEVSWADGLDRRHGFLAGDDTHRLAQMRDALENGRFDAVIPVRGGYGATRLLRDLHPEDLGDAPPLLIGFSDITALHALYARAGRCSMHGPMVAGLGRATPTQFDAWVRLMEGGPPPVFEGLTSVASGHGSGPLLGGNLAVLTALVGTRHAPPLDGAVLFLEDVGEAPYRVDRMLTQLRDAGWLDRIAGVALGSFTACAPRDDGRRVEDVLSDRLGDLGVPVVSGLPCGHAKGDRAIPLGVRVTVNGHRGALVVEERAVR
ncbi:MAG: LD-carboxypeptidase [Sandaracinaceae bacterium]